MSIAVTRHFMPVGVDLFNDRGKTFGQLAKDEQRSRYFGLTQKSKNTARIDDSSIRDRQIPVPGGLRPVFNVDSDDRGAVAHGFRHT